MSKTDLSVALGALRLQNPVMPASGTYDYFEENMNLFPLERLGAVMLKSVHRYPRPGNKPPRIAEVSSGMLNAVGIPTVGIERFIREELPKYRRLQTPVIMSISGSRAEDYTESVAMAEGEAGISALELNLSCPNIGTGLQFASDEAVLGNLVGACRKAGSRPLWIKLSPNVTDISRMAQICEARGADAVTIANTFMGMKMDIEGQKPALGNLAGGLSGPCIKPLILYMVYRTYQRVGIPIIASGGVATWRDGVEYLLAGASALQVGSANFANPLAMAEIIQGLDDYLYRKGISALKEIIGKGNLGAGENC